MWKLAGSWLSVYLTVNLLLAADPAPNDLPPETVLATVDDDKITEADFQLFCVIRNLPRAEQAPLRDKLLEQLIERQLIRHALSKRKIAADKEDVAGHVRRIEDLIRQRKEDPEVVLKKLGLSQETLASELALPLAWDAFVRQSVNDKQISEHFSQHKAELDGTKLRAAQIILLLPKGAAKKDVEDRTARLTAIRQDIVSKKIPFAEVAKKFSEAPSKANGGDVGWFPYRGKMPAPFCDAAFALKPGEISEPIVSPFGVHLIQVTDRQPGELTLDDVRVEILGRLSNELWDKTAAAERMKSKIDLAPRQ